LLGLVIDRVVSFLKKLAALFFRALTKTYLLLINPPLIFLFLSTQRL